MATFIVNQEIATQEPVIEVTIDPKNPLPPGRHRFRLVVVDDSKNTSAGDEIEVIIADQTAPNAVLNGPKIVATGNSFNLDGSKSFDLGGGSITSYLFTYLGQSLVITPPIIRPPIISTVPIGTGTVVNPGVLTGVTRPIDSVVNPS